MDTNQPTPSEESEASAMDITNNKPKKADEFSPLHEARVDREYATGNITGESAIQQDDGSKIPEADYTTNPTQNNESEIYENNPQDETQEFTENSQPGSTDTGQESFTTDDWNEMSPKEKRLMAEQSANFVVDTYNQYIPQLFVWAGSVPKRKVNKLCKEGKLNLDVVIKITDQKENVSVGTALNQINEKLEEAFKPDPNLKPKIIPPLTRIFMKRGIAMSDEQYVLSEVGKDILNKSMKLFELKGYITDLISAAVALTETLKNKPNQATERNQSDEHTSNANQDVQTKEDTIKNNSQENNNSENNSPAVPVIFTPSALKQESNTQNETAFPNEEIIQADEMHPPFQDEGDLKITLPE